MHKTIIVIFIFSICLIGCSVRQTVTETATLEPTLIPTPTTDPNSWELVWAEEFDQPDGSAPDPAKWHHQLGGAGWGNGELQYYSDSIDNSYIKDEMLVIKAINEYEQG